MKCCLVSSDVRDKLWPMPKHGSINLYVHGNQKAREDGQPRTSTSTLTQLLNYDSSLIAMFFCLISHCLFMIALLLAYSGIISLFLSLTSHILFQIVSLLGISDLVFPFLSLSRHCLFMIVSLLAYSSLITLCLSLECYWLLSIVLKIHW